MKALYCVMPLLWPLQLLAQRNELVGFDTRRQQLLQVPAVAFDTLLTKTNSRYSFGRLGAAEVAVLPTGFPVSNLVPGTAVAQRVRAATRSAPTSFPARTAVTISVLRNGQRTLMGSGSLIGERHVLTAAHVVASFSAQSCICANDFVKDSLLIEPAYDNGRSSGLPHSWAVKLYVPFNYLQAERGYSQLTYDIGLLELSQPIGRSVGWLGLGFDTDQLWVSRRVWHKFSYPGQDTNPDLNRYNGDTLYYEYGQFFPMTGITRLSAPNHNDAAFGQSGSSLFVTDNQKDWTTYGVLSSSPGFEHACLTPQHYAAFRKLMLAVPPGTISEFTLYPNPATNQLFLRLPDAVTGALQVQLTDMLGRVVHEQRYQVEADEVLVDLHHLSTGVYILTARAAQRTFAKKVVKIR